MKFHPRKLMEWINSRPRPARVAIKSLVGALGVAVFGPLLYFLIAALLSSVTVNRDFTPAKDGVEIFVWSNGVHADVIVPARTVTMDWTELFPPDEFPAVPPNPEYVAIGWGDKGFYLNVPEWRNLSPGIAFKALFLPSESAMHVTYLSRPSTDEFCRRTSVSTGQYEALVRFIRASVKTGGNGRAIRISAPGYHDSDGFYEALGSYNFIGTCNEWTGAGLRRAGVRMGVWTPLAKHVMKQFD